MRPLKIYYVAPNPQGELAFLLNLAYNLRWTWDADSRELLRRIDPDGWEKWGRNPVRMLGELDPTEYAQLAADDSLLYELKEIRQEFHDYMNSQFTWFQKVHSEFKGPLAAYFSAEFGVADCIPNYSGGLGILAGDHLKSASDMGVPLVGVGLLYQKGYFRQYLTPDGWQQELYPTNDFYTLPIIPVKDEQGKHQQVEIDFPGRKVYANIWQVDVGRTVLYLLDTNTPQNSPEDRDITSQLYGGTQETRIQQEVVLGMGGVKALEVLGIQPIIYHTNEGHAAFLILERIKYFMQRYHLDWRQAKLLTTASTLFTTHTPVPAGIDIFPRELMEKYFAQYVQTIGISMEELLSLGRMVAHDNSAGFNMAILAIRLSHATNAVSRLHRETSRKMWQNLWPGLGTNEVPIQHVTNGIHIPSWISNDMSVLFTRYLGPKWREEPRDTEVWKRIDQIPMEELWRTHERRRERLVAFARRRVKEQLKRQGVTGQRLEEAEEVLNPEALTIGFARRFAPYKRATLILRDLDRITKILTDKQKPVQIIIAGKAHPRDHFGKELIRTIVTTARRQELRRSIVFIEDYDMTVARYLVQGVDVWLNTPRRPKEASGTSGMKAVANGALHISTLDGWWAEVESDGLGWTIGHGEEYAQDQYDYQDEVEARALYDILENEVIPLFYRRGPDGLPRDWIRMMRNSMKTLCPLFNSNRMVRQYTEMFYIPAARRFVELLSNDCQKVKELAEWIEFMKQHWGKIKVHSVVSDIKAEAKVGDAARVQALVYLDQISPNYVTVEVVGGRIDDAFQIRPEQSVPMMYEGKNSEGLHRFVGVIPCLHSGRFGFGLRVLPKYRSLPHPFYVPGLPVHLVDYL